MDVGGFGPRRHQGHAEEPGHRAAGLDIGNDAWSFNTKEHRQRDTRVEAKMNVENKIYKQATTNSMDMVPETWLKKETQVLVACKHGNLAHIAGREDGNDWRIAADGAVIPSLYWKGTCDCHIYLKLDGWTP